MLFCTNNSSHIAKDFQPSGQLLTTYNYEKVTSQLRRSSITQITQCVFQVHTHCPQCQACNPAHAQIMLDTGDSSIPVLPSPPPPGVLVRVRKEFSNTILIIRNQLKPSPHSTHNQDYQLCCFMLQSWGCSQDLVLDHHKNNFSIHSVEKPPAQFQMT